MSAKPIKAGSTYLVKHQGRAHVVHAADAFAAIVAVLAMAGGEPCTK